MARRIADEDDDPVAAGAICDGAGRELVERADPVLGGVPAATGHQGVDGRRNWKGERIKGGERKEERKIERGLP